MKKALSKTIVFAMALCAWLCLLHTPKIRILASPGGEVGPFLKLFDRVRESASASSSTGHACRLHPGFWT